MAASTPLVLTAGALVITTDLLSDKWDTAKETRNAVATVVACFVSAGLDKVLPGFGTGLAVILVVGVAIKAAPPLMDKVFGSKA